MSKLWWSSLALVGLVVACGPRAEAQATQTFNPSQDNFIYSNLPNNVMPTGTTVPATALLVKNSGGATNNRKSYLQYNLASVPPNSVLNATLDLNFIDTQPFIAGSLAPGAATNFNFTVFALADGNDGWTEPTITWNNAPQNNKANGAGMIGAISLGTFSVTGKGLGLHSVALPNLVTFINGGGLGLDKLLSLVVVRTTAVGAVNAYVHGFNSDDAGSALAPNLVLSVHAPEPGAFSLIAVGLLPIVGMIYRRRRIG